MTWSPYISEIANLITYSTLKQNCFLEIVHDLNDLNYTKSIFSQSLLLRAVAESTCIYCSTNSSCRQRGLKKSRAESFILANSERIFIDLSWYDYIL